MFADVEVSGGARAFLGEAGDAGVRNRFAWDGAATRFRPPFASTSLLSSLFAVPFSPVTHSTASLRGRLAGYSEVFKSLDGSPSVS